MMGLLVPAAGWGVGGEPDTPILIPNCVLWLRADRGVTLAGSVVSTWADQSGNSRDFTEATNRPAVQASAINGQDAIRFDGSNDRLVFTGTWSEAAPFTVFTVFNVRTTVDLRAVWYCDNDAASTTPARLSCNNTNMLRFDGGGATGPSQSYTQNTWVVKQCYFNGSSSYMRNNDSGSVTSTPNNIGTTAMDGMSLGARFSDRFCAVDIAEHIVYSGEVTGADLATLQDYLSQRYAIW